MDDEARLLNAAQDIGAGHVPLSSGFPTSIHINEPPLAATIAAIPMLISRDPAWVAGCLAVLDAFAALFVYLAGRQVAGRFAALAAGLLYALAPGAIYFSRRIYYSEAEPFFVAFALLMCIRAWKWRSAPALAVGLVSAACAVELHATAGGILLVWLASALLIARKLSSWRPVLVACGIVLLTVAPYLYLQVQTGGADLHAALTFAAEPKHLDAQAPEIAASLVGGGLYQQQLLPRAANVPNLMLDPAGWLMLGLVVVGGALSWRYRAAWPAVLLIALQVLLTLRHSAGVLPYYELPLLPPAALLAGIALACCPWRVLAGAALAGIAAWQGMAYLHFQDEIAADGPALHYGMPLRYEEAAARALPALPSGSRVHFAQEGNQQFSFGYLTGGRYVASNSDSRYGLALPGSSEAYYVIQAGGAPYEFLQQISGGPLDVVRTPSGRPVFGLFAVPAAASHAYEGLPSYRTANTDFGAVRILGYAADELAAGKPSQLAVIWQVLDPNAHLPSDVQQFAHLVDGRGRTWSTGTDERAYPTSSWQAGDAVITWFELAPREDTPTGGYWLETGFYGYPGAEPLGPPLRVGPLRVARAASAVSGSPKAVFGDEMALLDARITGAQVQLTWQALRQPSTDYTVFVHVLDASDKFIEQDDSPPQAGAYPTSLWQAGDVVEDVHTLPNPPPDGSQLEVGLYTRPDLRRVETADGADRYVLLLSPGTSAFRLSLL